MPKTLTLFLKVLQYQHFAHTSGLLKCMHHITIRYVAARAISEYTGKLVKKTWRILIFRQIRQNFFPSKVFYCMVYNS